MQIGVSFDTLKSNYPNFKRLPKPLQDYMDGLNKNVKPGDPQNTSCCIQISHALNLSGQVVPVRSFWRTNPQIPGGSGYYLQAVDELEMYLAATFGRGEEIKTSDIATLSDSLEAIRRMKQRLDGRQGILLFRNGGAGFHVELWDKTHIIQNGAPAANGAAMSETGIFGQPRVVFWPAGEDNSPGAPVASLPGWLQGWWEVYDGSYYYYYFSSQYVVTYTKVKPKNLLLPPVKLPLNEGRVTLSRNSTMVVIDWNPADGGATKETFTRQPADTDSMAGVSNRYGALKATKI